MSYREARPSPSLARWVDRYWTRTGDGAVLSRILPDGCADVIFDVDAADGFVVGTMTTPLIIPPAPAAPLFGIRFRPGRALLGIGIPLAALTDTRAPLHDARSIAAGFAERVAAAPSFETRIAAVEQMLSRALVRTAADRVVDEAVAQIERSRASKTLPVPSASRGSISRASSRTPSASRRRCSPASRGSGACCSRCERPMSTGPMSRSPPATSINRISSRTSASLPERVRFHFSYRAPARRFKFFAC
jgi:uncharacterized protein DUF6597